MNTEKQDTDYKRKYYKYKAKYLKNKKREAAQNGGFKLKQ